MRRLASAAAAAALIVVGGSAARADVESAKRYVAQALDVADDAEAANAKLDLAEASLDDVAAADRAAIEASIAQAKKTIAAASVERDRARYKRPMARALDDLEQAIGDVNNWDRRRESLMEFLDEPKVQAALPDDVAAARKKLAVFDKLNAKKAGAARAARADAAIKELETAWQENRPKIEGKESSGERSAAISAVDDALQSARREMQGVPDDVGAPLAKRLDKVGESYATLVLAEEAAATATRLKEDWASSKDYYDGWKDEKTPPTLEAFKQDRESNMQELGAPKTASLITRANWFLDSFKNNEDWQKVASAPAVKAVVDGVRADRDAARAKLASWAERLYDEAAKAKLDDPTLVKLRNLNDQVERIFEGSDQLAALTARNKEIVANGERALREADDQQVAQKKAREAEQEAARAAGVAEADAAWPAMHAKFKTEDGFDPNAPAASKGKLIYIECDNMIGWPYAGDFPFASTYDGVPIAARYDPAVAKAVEAMQAKIGRKLGGEEDGKWRIVALVNGTKGKLDQRIDMKGQVRDESGNTATVTGERHEAVDAAVLTIVAARCGPMAASSK